PGAGVGDRLGRLLVVAAGKVEVGRAVGGAAFGRDLVDSSGGVTLPLEELRGSPQNPPTRTGMPGHAEHTRVTGLDNKSVFDLGSSRSPRVVSAWSRQLRWTAASCLPAASLRMRWRRPWSCAVRLRCRSCNG